MKLILPFPPSVNTYWRHPNKGAFAGKSLISAAGRKFQSAACAAIVEQLRRLPKPTSAPASVEIVLFPPDNRIRDLDNYNKALFDALTHAGVWEDDSQVKRMLVEWGPVIPKGKVEITISKYEKTAGAAADQEEKRSMNNLMVIDGIEVRRDAYGRYSLNDLHRAAVASGANARTKEPGKFLSSQQTVELVHELTNTQNLGVDPVSVIHGGNERGTYVCKELVYAYAMWISPSFHLKVIRTFDMVTSAPEKLSGQAADKMQAGVILLDFMRRELNLSNSSVLGACQKLQEAVGLPNLAPRYAIDAPADAHDGSSRPTLSLSALLKQYGIRLTANQAYHQMVKLGIVEQRERYSRTAINNIKKFWSLTAKGCMFGKNITSPANPRETQPHFFESRFPELLKLLDTVH